MLWPIVPLCERQLRDINPNHVLNGGLFRRCDIYKGGGGYDKFPSIAEKRLGIPAEELRSQFVVQLQGCPFNCPYCYVTEAGVHGRTHGMDTYDMMSAFKDAGERVFHLMGGAPAIYLNRWSELLEALPHGAVFHSDFLLYEKHPKLYNLSDLRLINQPNCLYAVSVKGSGTAQYLKNTGRKVDFRTIVGNLRQLLYVGVNFYVTFTGMTQQDVDTFEECLIMSGSFNAEETKRIMADSFIINLVEYEALKD